MDKTSPIKRRFNAAQLSALGFLLLILLGTLGFMLPFMHLEQHDWRPLLALFEATSAICVTGLSRVAIDQYYSIWGQLWLLFLIQIGGLGYMILYSYMLIALRQELSLRHKHDLSEILALPGPTGSLKFVLRIVRFTLVIEVLGTLCLALDWVPRLGWGRGLYYSAFHSISAFNNAGFSLYHDSLMSFQRDPFILSVIATLVLLGGLGYPVLSELYDRWQRRREQPNPWQWKHLSLHSRVSLISTVVLFSIGFVFYLLLESFYSLQELSFFHRVSGAFFMSVMPRTAGFNALDMGQLSMASLVLTSLLMFVGANPGGTGGGTKTTTWVVLWNMSFQFLKGQREAVLLNRQIPQETQLKSVAILMISITWVALAFMLISLSDAHLGAEKLLFEVISAFGTVGLSLGITGSISVWGQGILLACMYMGRVGIISIALALWPPSTSSLIKYPQDQIIVG